MRPDPRRELAEADAREADAAALRVQTAQRGRAARAATMLPAARAAARVMQAAERGRRGRAQAARARAALEGCHGAAARMQGLARGWAARSGLAAAAKVSLDEGRAVIGNESEPLPMNLRLIQ